MCKYIFFSMGVFIVRLMEVSAMINKCTCCVFILYGINVSMFTLHSQLQSKYNHILKANISP